MFIEFFYKLKETGIPVSPTSFLTLHRALDKGLIGSLDDFYTSARSILQKGRHIRPLSTLRANIKGATSRRG